MFAPVPGYLNTAALGAPPLAALTALQEVLDGWRRGRLQPPDFDEAVSSSRRAWASLSGVDAALVATGSTVSQFIGLVAAALPDGARVVTAAGDTPTGACAWRRCHWSSWHAFAVEPTWLPSALCSPRTGAWSICRR